MKTELTIIIPVYNEEARINNLALLFRYLHNFPHRVEVILVNDGSRDSTADNLAEVQKKYGFRIISYAQNRGKGYAVREGIKKSHGEYILITDIDFSVPITFVTRFWQIRQSADIVIATRRHPKSKVLVHQSVPRELSGWGFSALTRVWLGLGVSDVTCGFKLFESNAAKTIFSKSRINRFAYDAESLFLAKKLGFTVIEEPVAWKNDPLSTVVFPGDVVTSFVDLLGIRIRHTLRE